MASDKEQMMSSANYYAGLVTAAKNDCADAFVQLTTPINEIDRYWKGAAGAQIKRLHDRLVYLESQMKAQAANIYNTWPESETVTEDGV